MEYQGLYCTKVGYAAFAKFGLSLDELKLLVSSGYPIIVAMRYSREWPEGHYRVVVGYNETRIAFHDLWFNPPYKGPNVNISYSEFLYLWQFSSYWGLFVSPWAVSISCPEEVEQHQTFNVKVTVTYPCPQSFYTDDYRASMVNITITLSEGLKLLPNETSRKSLEFDLYPTESVTVNWTIKAEKPGNYTILVESEGKITSYNPYYYEDIIGGFSNTTINVLEASTPLRGDVNHDGTVNLTDVLAIASIYGCEEGRPCWIPEADLAPPYGKINIYDVVACIYVIMKDNPA